MSQRKINLLNRLKMVQLRAIAKVENVKSASKKSKLIKNIIDAVGEKEIETHFKKYSQTGKFNIRMHVLVPQYRRLSAEEAKKVFEKYDVTKAEMPKILVTDPMAVSLAAEIGDVVEIKRKSQTAGVCLYYRIVVPV